MSKVHGKVEPQKEIEPNIVSPQLGADNPHLGLPQHLKLLDNQMSWIGVWNDNAGLTAFLNKGVVRARLIVRQKPVQTFCAHIPLPHFREADGLTHAITCFAHD
jgi:hypothetical protein